MAQEFTINSSAIESKINQLLPSQGGFGAGVDFSASTMVIPIVDLTEAAEGADVRADIQTALSLNSINPFYVNNTPTPSTLINTTGYYRVFGNALVTAAVLTRFQLTDGTTTKTIAEYNFSGGTAALQIPFDFIVYLIAGVSLIGFAGSPAAVLTGNFRQIADVSGNLVNP
jgi:hypothetical protein